MNPNAAGPKPKKPEPNRSLRVPALVLLDDETLDTLFEMPPPFTELVITLFDTCCEAPPLTGLPEHTERRIIQEIN